MNKESIRKQLKLNRQSLSKNECTVKSQRICRCLAMMDWSTIRTLHHYEPLLQLNEANINSFITLLHTDYPKLELYTSRNFNGTWEIVTRLGNRVSKIPQFDAVIIPALGFDSRLNRIGYGGGYYDKFLATQTTAQKIGVCFEIGKLKHIPTEPYDIALDLIVTEAKVYEPQMTPD